MLFALRGIFRGNVRLGWSVVLLAASITGYAQSRDRILVEAPKQEIADEAPATAPRELPRAGDSWSYRLTERPHGQKPVQSRYVVKVKASSSTKVLDEVTRDGAAPVDWTHSPGWHMVPQVVSVFSPYLVVFGDLKPGDRIWRVTEHDDVCFGWVYCATAGRVEGREILKLPAGSFQTIKVTLDQIVTKRPGPMVGASSGSRTLTIWYSPQAKRAVKITSRASDGLSTPFHANFDLELVSYQLQ